MTAFPLLERKGVKGLTEGRIRKIDLRRRLAVIDTNDGQELTVTFDGNTNIEVIDPATGGNMTGSLEDLKEGYWVQVAFREQDGHFCCRSLISLS